MDGCGKGYALSHQSRMKSEEGFLAQNNGRCAQTTLQETAGKALFRITVYHRRACRNLLIIALPTMVRAKIVSGRQEIPKADFPIKSDRARGKL